MSLRGLVAIGWCLYGDGEDGGVDAGTVMIIAFCRDSNDRARQLSVAISIATIDTPCILVFRVTDERHARGKACWRSFRALDIRYCKRLLSFWVVQLDYAIEEVWNAAMAICI